MRIQTLIATMNQSDHSLLDKMNIQTDAIVGNQCDKNEISDFTYKGRKVKWISLNERGVGLNRNTTLMRATADIVLFADDDVVYFDGYENIILDYYESHPDADLVIFNFKMRRGQTTFYERVTKEGRVFRKDAAKYGTYCISARRERIRFANVYFHLDFGGGARYSSGEDSAFLQECIKKKLKIYSSKKIIGVVDHGESTWFSGYTDKFFYDKGVWFYKNYPKLSFLLAFYHCCKHRDLYKEYGWKKAFLQMKKGICEIARGV